MKYYFLLLLFPVLMEGCTNKATVATKWVVNRKEPCQCTAQDATAQPQLGKKILGPYATKQEAIDAMCNIFDPTGSDFSKCWTVQPQCP